MKLIKWVNFLLIVITLCCYLVPFINPEDFWVPSLLGHIFPVLYISQFFFLVFWALKKHWYAIFSLGLILLGADFGLSLFSLGNLKAAASHPVRKELKVLSFNCFHLRVRKSFKRTSPNEWNGLVAKMGASIACFQEFPLGYHKSKFLKPYLSELEKEFKYCAQPSTKRSSLVIYSKFPVVNQGERIYQNGSNGFFYADLDIDGTIVRVINMHLQSYSVSGMVRGLSGGRVYRKGKVVNTVVNLLKRYKDGIIKRAIQARDIHRLVRQSPYPVIVCGDMNDIRLSYAYRTIAHSLLDAFKAKGFGYGTTYAGTIPGLKIDYIFASPEIQINAFQIEKNSSISDHFPVWAILNPVP